jgi:hypothetical protein
MKKITAIGTICFLVILWTATGVSAQSRVFRGKITLFRTYPVMNLEITAKKAKTTTLTNENGEFSLDCNTKDMLLIKDRVFQPVAVNLGEDDHNMEINLIFKDTPKNRQFAVSQGYISEEDLSYGLANLQSENNDFCNYDDIFTLIRMKFTEVEVRNTGSGELGVYIQRGPKSFFEETNALYIVDGVRMQDISFVNPCEISDIRIVTEGGAAIYGAGARNGAVVIETKKAR